MKQEFISKKVSFLKMVQRTSFCLFCFFVLSNAGFAQLNPDAGYIPSYTVGATVSATSTHPGTDPSNIIDGNPETFWLSEGCLPSNYITRPDLNILLGVCIDGLYSSSGVHGTGDLCDITDGNLHTGPWLLVQDGSTWFEIELENPSTLNLIGARVYVTSSSSAVITVSAFTTIGTEINVGTFSTTNDGFPLPLKNFEVPTEEEIVRIRVSSNQQFQLMELAALSGPLYDAITIDFGEVKEISWIEKLNKSLMEVTAIVLETSTDNVNWTFLADLDPTVTSWIKIRLEIPVYARYLRFKHELKNMNYVKAYLYEVRVYDEYGPFAPPPAPQINTHTFSELLGVNSQRHWGTSTFSDLLSENEGPLLFSRFSAHGRCYHNWRQDLANWGSSDPLANNPPNYVDGWSTGDIWSREYAGWVSAGLEVEATIQFLNSRDLAGNISGTTLLVEEFNGYNVVDEAYKFGQKYAGYFGSTNKNVVKVMEVGNEPWNYPADFYRDILYGMAKGIKETDPNMVVLPCALNAHEPEQAGADGGRYIGARLSEREVPYIDALNIHVYSWMFDANGNRIGIHPEHPESDINAVRNMIRFRDNNPILMGKPIYVTEWGWDSDGCNQPCDHNECVSEYAQAVYAVRSALLFSRLGLDRLTWYHYTNDLWFYLNPQNPSSIWMRSGVTCSVEGMLNLPLKKSFIAFEAMVNTIGDRHFVDVIREDSEAYVYLLGDLDGTPTHVAAWRPIDVDRDNLSPIIINLTVDGFPGNAWHLSGESPYGEPVTLSDPNSWILEVTETPLVIEIEERNPLLSFILLADKKIKIAGLISSEGQIHSNDKIEIKKGLPSTHFGNLTAVGDVKIDKNNTIEGDVFAGGEIDLKGNAEITGTKSEHAEVAIVPLPVLSFTAGGDKVTVEEEQSESLSPGSYGKVVVKKRGTLALSHDGSSGDYFFNELDLKDQTTLTINVSNGQVTINVVKELHFHKNTEVTIESPTEKKSRQVIFNCLKKVELHKDAIVSGSFFVPDDKVFLHKNVLFKGTICAKEIDIDKNVTLLHHASGNSLVKASSMAAERDDDEEKNTKKILIPTEFNLKNYPNPFNANTTIDFSLPEAVQISIVIYDINGRLIETLFQGKTGPGNFRLNWDGKEYSTGIYFLKFSSKKFNKTVKLTLIK